MGLNTLEQDKLAVLGCNEQHIVCDVRLPDIWLHSDVVIPLVHLQQAARKAGFDLAVASSFRSFERQQWLWNNKLNGSRPVLDDAGCPIDVLQLPHLERVFAVMRWSALPGTSRHHWGTDFDIYDRAAVDSNYQLQLVPEEYQGDGPFAPMIHWLDDYLATDASGFYRPYLHDCGGVACEPWHISYRPVAEIFEARFDTCALKMQLQASELLEKKTVIEHLDSLLERFVLPQFSLSNTQGGAL